MSALLGKGIYTLSDVSRLTGHGRSSVYRWFQDDARFLHSEHGKIDGSLAVSFLDLIDVYVAGELRSHKVPLRELRLAYERLQLDLDTAHPFSHKGILVAGGKVFVDAARQSGTETLYHVVSGQHFMREVMAPHLKPIDYGKVSRLAEAWNISHGVEIKPGVSMGRPVVKGTGTSTRVLYDAWRANGRDEALVSELYQLPVRTIGEAVAFEESLRERQAA